MPHTEGKPFAKIRAATKRALQIKNSKGSPKAKAAQRKALKSRLERVKRSKGLKKKKKNTLSRSLSDIQNQKKTANKLKKAGRGGRLTGKVNLKGQGRPRPDAGKKSVAKTSAKFSALLKADKRKSKISGKLKAASASKGKSGGTASKKKSSGFKGTFGSR